MPNDSSQLTVGNGSNVGSVAGVQSTPPPFMAKQGTTVGDLSNNGVPATQSSLAQPNNYLQSAPTLPIPKTSTGAPTVFGSQAQPATNTGTLSDFLPTPTQTSTGGFTASHNGQVTGGTGFNVDTSGVNSSSLISSPTNADILAQQNQYQQKLQQLAQANKYSPAYINAFQNVQNANLSQAAIGNQVNNPDLAVGTTGQLQGLMSRESAGNALNSANANIALQAQALARQGDIAGATALAQGYAPTTVSPGSALVSPATGQETYSGIGGLTGVNAADTYNQLQQYYPGANIPAYNSNLTPQQNQQIAQNLVAGSPQYNAQFQSTYTTPGGGTGVFNKTALSQLQQNPDGTYQLVSGADAAMGAANAGALKTQVDTYNNTKVAFDTVDKQFGMLTQLMNQYGLNQSGIPLINQIQNKVKAGVLAPGVIGAFNLAVQELRTNLSTVISRGGSVAGANQEAQNLVPDNLSPQQMGSLGDTITKFGTAAVQQIQTQVNQITSQIPGGQTQSQSSVTNPFSGTAWGS